MNERISVLTLILAMSATPALACSGGGSGGGGGDASATGASSDGGGSVDVIGLPQWAQAYVPHTVELVGGYNFEVTE